MTRYLTIDGHKIAIDGNLWTIPALGGEDVNRMATTICIERIDGDWHSPSGGEMDVSDGGELRGWGTLDGPSTRVGRCNIPTALLRKVEAMADTPKTR